MSYSTQNASSRKEYNIYKSLAIIRYFFIYFFNRELFRNYFERGKVKSFNPVKPSSQNLIISLKIRFI